MITGIAIHSSGYRRTTMSGQVILTKKRAANPGTHHKKYENIQYTIYR